jgi:hypothetical protein
VGFASRQKVSLGSRIILALRLPPLGHAERHEAALVGHAHRNCCLREESYSGASRPYFLEKGAVYGEDSGVTNWKEDVSSIALCNVR